MPLIIVAFGILILMLLIVVFKLNSFISFIIVSIIVGIAEGMTPGKVLLSLQSGIGNTLSSMVLILGFGAMLGKLVADSGAAQKLTTSMVRLFGVKHIQYALVVTGFIVGIPMFYSVGFVILIPLIFAVALNTRLPLLYIGIPMLASLSVTHGFLPPHPSPTAIAVMFKADLGKTLLFGLAIAIPAITIAGPLFSRTLKNIKAVPLKEFTVSDQMDEYQLPGFWNSLFSALLPLLIIASATLFNFFVDENTTTKDIVNFIGHPAVALLISVLVSVFSLGLFCGKTMTEVMNSISASVSGITMILFIIAGAGALSQVLSDSGVSVYIGELFNKSGISPLFLGWLIATIIRVCVGSATIAGLTTAGIVAPMVTTGTANAELMVIAIGAGSLMFSHVNDGGFWLFKEYFNLSVKDTLKSWTVMETMVGTIGLIGVLVMNQFV
ncbi:MAG: gluconate:H+ symporter [Bacteroidales bacterium]